MSFESKIFNTLLNHTATIKRPIFRYDIGVDPWLYWPFDWNAKDYSGNGRDGTLGADTTNGTGTYPILSPGGMSGNSMYFDGLSAVVYNSTAQFMALNAGKTISFWIKPDGLYSCNVFTELASTGVLFEGTNLSMSSGGILSFALRNSAGSYMGGAAASAGYALTSGQWTHVAIAVYSTGSVRMYFNGVYDSAGAGSYTVTGALPTSTILGLGGAYQTSQVDTHFKGWIDEFTLFNSTLTAGNILSIYSNTPVKDNSGRPQSQSTKLTQGVACHFSEHRLPGAITSGKEGLIFQVEYTKQQPICVFPYSTDVAVQDTVLHEQTGDEYEVEAVEDSAGQSQHKRVFLKRFE